MLKIAVISDTHTKAKHEDLLRLLEDLRDCDYILHAGDFISQSTVKVLEKHPGFIGVSGNADDTWVKQNLKDKEILKLVGYRIGLVHGDGDKKTTIERAMASFEEGAVDIIIFGHSHQPLIQTKNQILLLNPGSPINKRKEKWYSYILLELWEDSIEARLCFKAFK